MMTNTIVEHTDADQEQVRAISDCLEACTKNAARALQLAVTHRLFGRSQHLREAAREADAAKLACERALQLLGAGFGLQQARSG